ncbi:hypothetical protein D910_01219 [Dendroctonus ponderosae]|uniref:VWFC domain-containing protein n=1 Tax=Dendroctonus ponderosae TaxID=77166 RepID=U4U030_DENPD|nr:hypothetical protein D910_01219 [Dendroctonus ponderosae]
MRAFQNGLVECKNTCPKTDGCHLVVTDGCCKVCKGCNYKGVAYASHTDWSEPANPCKVMRCEAGVVTISDMHCYTPCPNPLPPEPGKCCPTCSGTWPLQALLPAHAQFPPAVCKFNGQVVAEDRDVVSEDDPCLKCRCSRGRLTCAKRSCPVLQCSRAMQERAPGECCPRCNGTRAILLVPNTCPIQRSFFREGQALKLDKCIECACVNSTSVCTRSACPILECAPELQRTFPAHCCPTCIQQPTDELISQCHYAGHAYEAGTSRATPPSRFNARFVRQDGNVWKLDACSSCECHDGKVSCARIRCNTTCAAGMKQINVEGECCPHGRGVYGVRRPALQNVRRQDLHVQGHGAVPAGRAVRRRQQRQRLLDQGGQLRHAPLHGLANHEARGHQLRGGAPESAAAPARQVQRAQSGPELREGGAVCAAQAARGRGGAPAQWRRGRVERAQLPRGDGARRLQGAPVRPVRQLQRRPAGRAAAALRQDGGRQGRGRVRRLLVRGQKGGVRPETEDNAAHARRRGRLQALERARLWRLRVAAEQHQILQGLQDGHVQLCAWQVLLREPDRLLERVRTIGRPAAAQLAQVSATRSAHGDVWLTKPLFQEQSL